MAAVLLPNGKQDYQTATGEPLVGGKLRTFDAGTNNPRPTFLDAAANDPNTNPVILDGRGEAVIFWRGAYKVELLDAHDVVIWTVDGVQGVDVAIDELRDEFADTTDPTKGDALVGVKQPFTGAVARTQHDKNADVVSVTDFGAIGNDSFDCTAAFQTAANLGRGIFIPKGIYKINGSINCPDGCYFYGEGCESRIKQYAAASVFVFPTSGGSTQKHFRDFMVRGDNAVAPGALAGVYVFRFPGTPAGAAPIYTSGYRFSGITLGNGERIGGGWHLEDTFRCAIHDCGMVNVATPVNIVGNVVQCSLHRIINNNSLSHLIGGNSFGVCCAFKATYADAASRGPENLQIINCGLVRQNIGARLCGLFIVCRDNDFDFLGLIGVEWIGGEGGLTVDNNYIASGTTGLDFIGIKVPLTQFVQEPHVITNNFLAAYAVLPGASTAIRYGAGNLDPFSEPEGGVIERNRVRQVPSITGAWAYGIDMDRNKLVRCNNNSTQEGSCRTYAIRATYQHNSTLIGNDCGTGILHLDAPAAGTGGVVLQNRCVFTQGVLGTPANWLIHQY